MKSHGSSITTACAESPQRIAAARARLARLRMPNSYDRVRTRLDSGLRLIAFMAKHNPIAAQIRATTWELGAAGLIPRWDSGPAPTGRHPISSGCSRLRRPW